MINENEQAPIEETADTSIAYENHEADEPHHDAPLTSAEANESEEAPDYDEILRSDMQELTEAFSNGEPIKITDLKNPIRYGALRDMGLTPSEAYLASGGKKEKQDNRAHLASSVPRKLATSFSEIPRAELNAARELFSDMSDAEIRSLYKKVTQ